MGIYESIMETICKPCWNHLQITSSLCINPMELPRDSYDILWNPMEILREFCGNPEGILWKSHRNIMELIWNTHGIYGSPTKIPWSSYANPIEILRKSMEILRAILWSCENPTENPQTLLRGRVLVQELFLGNVVFVTEEELGSDLFS